jgi:hypothetical protein
MTVRHSALAAALLSAGLAFMPALALDPDYSVERSVPETGVINFDVERNGSDFGTHKITFTREGEVIEAVTDVDLIVKIGPFTPFKYTLDVEESFRDGQLISLNGSVLDSGDTFTVEAFREGDEIQVQGSKFTGAVPANTFTSSWWNAALLRDDDVISTEDGAITPIKVTELGDETITTRFGEVNATRYRVESDITLDLWYDEEGHWVGTAFEARGQDIRYVLAEPVR